MMKYLLLILAFGVLYSNGNAKPVPPNFIIFIADDVSWDDFGCYGDSQVRTPNIDKLASAGLRFTNVYLTASSCSPSRNSIMTGRYPHNTGAAELHTEPPLGMLSFAEVLRSNNYYSAQAGKFHMGKYAKRGFDRVYEKSDENGDGGERMWVDALKERPRDKPFFMWFASYDAHRAWGPNPFSGTHNPAEITPPFYLADGDETKVDLGKYYDEIKRFDYSIGEVVDQLVAQKVLENTVIIIMADNGRPFPHSKTRVNDRGMKTPFIVHYPALIKKGGNTCNSLISAIDIPPTMMKLAGIDSVPAQFQGYSFDQVLTTPQKPFRHYVFAEHNWHDYEAHERMIRNQHFMYIRNFRPLAPQMGPADAVESPSFQELVQLKDNGSLTAIQADVFAVPRPREELYDLQRDPLQLLNLASLPEYADTLKNLSDKLQKWMIETGDDVPENLTKDWYQREPGYLKTEDHNIRGEMPGAKSKATQNNHKGEF
ncbi:MAG: sulfatase [Bacteroidia bacterium]